MLLPVTLLARRAFAGEQASSVNLEGRIQLESITDHVVRGIDAMRGCAV